MLQRKTTAGKALMPCSLLNRPAPATPPVLFGAPPAPHPATPAWGSGLLLLGFRSPILFPQPRGRERRKEVSSPRPLHLRGPANPAADKMGRLKIGRRASWSRTRPGAAPVVTCGLLGKRRGLIKPPSIWGRGLFPMWGARAPPEPLPHRFPGTSAMSLPRLHLPPLEDPAGAGGFPSICLGNWAKGKGSQAN